MKLPGTLDELHQVIDQNLTVREIAEPLASFDRDADPQTVAAFAEAHGFDLVGLREQGSVTAVFEAGSGAPASLADAARTFSPTDDVLPDHEPMTNALHRLAERQWLLVRSLGGVNGMVTRSDVQKTPVRLWLFGVITLAELTMTETIRCCVPHWKANLSEGKLQKARNVQADRRRENLELKLVDCLFLTDKSDILKKEEDLRSTMGFGSGRRG